MCVFPIILWLSSPTIALVEKAAKSESLVFCCNLCGSDKRRLLMIAKYARPRCFKHVDICRFQVECMANKNTWMTAEIWNRWLTALIVTYRGCWIVDNANCHHVLAPTHQAVKLIFFSPNTTSLIQPLDQGIIQFFKMHNRPLLHLEGKVDVALFKCTLLDAVNLCNTNRKNVTRGTIYHCFCHWFLCSPLMSKTMLNFATSSPSPTVILAISSIFLTYPLTNIRAYCSG